MRWWKTLAERIVLALLTVLVGGLLSATLARYAPGFGADERLLDTRLSHESVEAIRQESPEERATVSYYAGSLRRMLWGDFGTSRTLRRPVKELLAERSLVTLRLVAAGLGCAWTLALVLVLASWLADCSALDMVFLVSGGALLCLPVGAVALLLVLADAPASLAIALTVFPKFYRYLHNLVRADGKDAARCDRPRPRGAAHGGCCCGTSSGHSAGVAGAGRRLRRSCGGSVRFQWRPCAGRRGWVNSPGKPRWAATSRFSSASRCW